MRSQHSNDRKAATTSILCFLVALVEGYDLQSAGIAAPRLVPVFGLSATELAWVFSSSTIGLLIGAVIGGRLADRIGCKGLLIGSLLTFGVFSIGTAVTTEVGWLLTMRFLTGLGLGGAFPTVIALVAEAGKEQYQASRVTMVTAGVPFGGAIACLFVLAAPDLDWTYIFHIGGVAPILLAGAIAFALPAAPGRVPQEQKRSALHNPIGVVNVLFGGGRTLSTLALWASSFCTLTILYLLLNWLPVLMLARGVTRTQALCVALSFSGGGAAGALLLGYLMGKGVRVIVLVAVYAGIAAGLSALATVTDAASTVAAATLAGFFVIGAQFVLYGLSADYYPKDMRGTGVGSAVALGRLGAIAGPLMAGAVLTLGGTADNVVLLLLPLATMALFAALLLVLKGQTAVADGSKSNDRRERRSISQDIQPKPVAEWPVQKYAQWLQAPKP